MEVPEGFRADIEEVINECAFQLLKQLATAKPLPSLKEPDPETDAINEDS